MGPKTVPFHYYFPQVLKYNLFSHYTLIPSASLHKLNSFQSDWLETLDIYKGVFVQ